MWGKTPDSTNSFTYFTEETWTFVSELSAESANFMPDSKTVEILQNQRPLSRKIHPDGLDHHLIWPMIHMCLVKGLCICFSKGNLLVFPVLFTQWSTQQWSPLALFPQWWFVFFGISVPFRIKMRMSFKFQFNFWIWIL